MLHTRIHLLLATSATLAAGHGVMTHPPSRSKSSQQLGSLCSSLDPTTNGTCMWFRQGCSIGCANCTSARDCGPLATNCCGATMKATLNDPELRTYFPVRGLQAACRRNESPEDKAACVTIKNAGCDKMSDEPCDTFPATPWRAPGFAGLDMPCGIAGGGFGKPDLQTGCLAPKDRYMGFDGRDLPKYTPLGQKVAWTAGSAQEVSWGFTANHGGGYAYRLCPASSELTEECFERGHLKFVGESWLQWGSNKNSRKAYNATRVSVGTHPAGSMWTKHPIPACAGAYGGAQHCQPNDHAGMNCTCDKPQFQPKVPGVFGFGIGHCAFPLPAAHGLTNQCKGAEAVKTYGTFSRLNIVDQVQIPATLAPGDYVLSWRWDCEQTPQIWAGCGDVTINAPDTDVVV